MLFDLMESRLVTMVRSWMIRGLLQRRESVHSEEMSFRSDMDMVWRGMMFVGDQENRFSGLHLERPGMIVDAMMDSSENWDLEAMRSVVGMKPREEDYDMMINYNRIGIRIGTRKENIAVLSP